MKYRLPAHAVGRFPWNRPTPHLRDIQLRIEAMLAPVSDKRQRVSAMPFKYLQPATQEE